MAQSFLAKTQEFFRGLGYVQPPNSGNRANAPADPPVQEGNYQFIQWQMLGGAGDNQAIVNVPEIPPAFRDWDGYPVNEYGVSGLTGGGAFASGMPLITNGPILYFDEATGLYVDLEN